MANAPNHLVLLPGLDGTGRLFWRLKKELGDGIAVTTIRYPDDARVGYEELVPYVRERIGDEPCVVLGESFSGPIAVALAASRPQQVRGVIMAATFLRIPYPSWIVRAAAAVEPSAWARPLVNFILKGFRSDPELQAEIGRIMKELPASVRARRLREVAQVDVSQAYLALRCPVLVLQARGDWLVTGRQLRAVTKLKDHAEVRTFPGAHMLLQTNAAAAAQDIKDFLANIGTAE